MRRSVGVLLVNACRALFRTEELEDIEKSACGLPAGFEIAESGLVGGGFLGPGVTEEGALPDRLSRGNDGGAHVSGSRGNGSDAEQC